MAASPMHPMQSGNLPSCRRTETWAQVTRKAAQLPQFSTFFIFFVSTQHYFACIFFFIRVLADNSWYCDILMYVFYISSSAGWTLFFFKYLSNLTTLWFLQLFTALKSLLLPLEMAFINSLSLINVIFLHQNHDFPGDFHSNHKHKFFNSSILNTMVTYCF